MQTSNVSHANSSSERQIASSADSYKDPFESERALHGVDDTHDEQSRRSMESRRAELLRNQLRKYSYSQPLHENNVPLVEELLTDLLQAVRRLKSLEKRYDQLARKTESNAIAGELLAVIDAVEGRNLMDQAQQTSPTKFSVAPNVEMSAKPQILKSIAAEIPILESQMKGLIEANRKMAAELAVSQEKQQNQQNQQNQPECQSRWLAKIEQDRITMECMTRENGRLQDTLNKVSRECDVHRAEVTQLAAALRAADVVRSRATSQLEQHVLRPTTNVSQQAEVDRLNWEVGDLRRQIDTLTEDVHEGRQRLSVALEGRHQQQFDLETLKSSRDELAREIEREKKLREEMEQNLNWDLGQSRLVATNFMKENNRMTVQLKNYEAELIQQSNELGNWRQAAAKTQAREKLLSEELRACQSLRSEDMTNLSQLANENEKLNFKLQEAAVEKRRLEKELLALNSRIAKANEINLSIEKSKKLLEDDVGRRRLEASDLVKSMHTVRRQLDDRDVAFDQLTAQLADANAAHFAVGCALQEKSRREAEFIGKVNELTMDMDMMTVRLGQIEKERQAFQGRCRQLEILISDQRQAALLDDRLPSSTTTLEPRSLGDMDVE